MPNLAIKCFSEGLPSSSRESILMVSARPPAFEMKNASAFQVFAQDHTERGGVMGFSGDTKQSGVLGVG